MKATGDSGQCGARAIPLASASAPISAVLEMPPTWTRSGWRMCAPLAATTSLNSATVHMRSPVAMGTQVVAAISGSQRL